jgi:hypothetical protein
MPHETEEKQEVAQDGICVQLSEAADTVEELSVGLARGLMDAGSAGPAAAVLSAGMQFAKTLSYYGTR